MASTIGGDDLNHDLSPQEKDQLEKELREKARDMIKKGKSRERKKYMDRAQEISHRKSKIADHH